MASFTTKRFFIQLIINTRSYLDFFFCGGEGFDTSKLFNCFCTQQHDYKGFCVIVHDNEQLETMLTNKNSQNEGVKMDEW